MEELKKAEVNIVNFISDSLKNSKINYVNGELPIMDEMRTLSDKSLKSASPSPNPKLSLSKPNPTISIVLKLIGVLLLLFLIYKIIITYFPTIIKDIKNKINDIYGIVEKDVVKIETKLNPMFNTSNNLNSNQILDYLLNKKPSNQWCFVGESNKKRYCTLAQGEQCMSGNIFPSKEICINPKLKV